MHENEDALWAYNAQDCARTRECGEAELQAIAQMGLQEVDAFQQRLFWPVLRAMQLGVRVDLQAKKRMAQELEAGMTKREAYFHSILGHKLNPRSTKQMQALFYGDLKQPPIMSRATKASPSHLSCDAEALSKIALREPLLRPLIRAIEEYRTLGVLLSTFVLMPLDTDSRMRCSYNICGTETFRFSSSENAFGTGGNLQNVPKGGEEDDGLVLPNIRRLFVPDPGYTFFDTDLSKADLRVVVWEADEREMKAMLAEGRDPYVETAREYHKDPTIAKTRSDGSEHPIYKRFKSFSHGTHYLGTARGLAARLGMLVHEAERAQRWYFARYPKIAEWQKRFTAEVRAARKVKNRFGYQRIYFDRVDDAMVREAIAWLPQSTVACTINRAWVNLYDHAPEIQVLLQVHDSLAGQFPTPLAAECLEKFKTLTRIEIPYDDPLVIPIGIKTSEESWGAC